MSTRYPGGVITKTPVVPAGPYESGAAPGIWTLDQQLQAQKAGIWPLAGNPVPYIEDVFSTYLYTGNDVALTVTNGIDLSGKGGLVWGKSRSGIQSHRLYDTARGSSFSLRSDLTNAESNQGANACAFNSNGFSLSAASGIVGSSGFGGPDYVSWTFREQPKFFDIVTYTGTGAVQNIAHNLGSVPGCIIVKKTNDSSSWITYHRGLNGGTNPSQYFVALNLTNAEAASSNPWNNTAPTSAVFTAGLTNSEIGINYVAYLFAHDAGGFGLSGTDNVISCGSTTGGGATVNLGYEPQWLLMKKTNGAQNWFLMDNMRGLDANQGDQALSPNLSSAEPTASSNINITSTGFINVGLGTISDTYIYIAIRRGPMKVPTDATKVFSPQALNAPANGTQVTTGFPVDLSMFKARDGGPSGQFQDRLRGLPSTAGTGTPALYPDATAAESTNQTGYEFWNTGYRTYTAQNAVWWMFGRAPGFFDEVCYTGTGVGVVQNVSHNLGVVPTLMIVKSRAPDPSQWRVYDVFDGADNYMALNTTAATASGYGAYWGNSTTPTSSVFSVSSSNNISAGTFVAYLFSTCPGVSKVGSYTGTGTTLQIDCGFTAGSRFVMIKRTDSTGDWYVWDSARGIIAGNDPYLFMNSTAAEVTGTDYVDTYSAGFEISSTAPAAINANGGSFLFLAIA